MEPTGPVTFGGFDEPLNETLEKQNPMPRQRYQRKVRVTMTRAEAELVRRLLLRVSTEKLAAQVYCQYGMGVKTIMSRFKNVWKKIDRQIEKRDTRQRQKESVDQPQGYWDGEPDDGEKDVPLF